jgi:CheY-like chemotaxis protein
MPISQSLKERRILIVEDNYFLALEMSTLLKREGAQTIGPAASLRQALKLVRGEILHAAVLDVNLGEGDAYSVARELQARAVPFIFVTGYIERHVPFDLRHQIYLEKPVRPEHLIRVLRQIIEERMAS